MWTDLNELKSILEIDPEDTTEDKRLNFFMSWSAALVEQYLNRPGYVKAARTEYYDGSGTQKLILRCRPVYLSPTPRVFVDVGGLFGSTDAAFASTSELTYGTDFALEGVVDGVSRRAILVRRNNLWPKVAVRHAGYLTPWVDHAPGAVKVVYTAGWTADTVPGDVIAAMQQLIARMRFMFPTGLPVSSDSYEDRSISISVQEKDWLLGHVKHLLNPHRNRRW